MAEPVIIDAGTAPGYVVTLPPVTPSPRGDTVPWTVVGVDEGPGPLGPWTALGTSDIDPVDDDAGLPADRAVIIRGAHLERGFYRVTFRDDAGNASPIRPVFSGGAWSPTGLATDQWKPDAQAVADLIVEYTRTRADALSAYAGAITGSFDETTDPTEETVEAYIRAACREISGRVAAPITAQLASLAATAAAQHAAAAVEAAKSEQDGDEADSAKRWHLSSYIATLGELTTQARFVPLNLS